MARSLRVGCVQLAPVHGDSEASAARADALLEQAQVAPGRLDVLLLPELAFSGYVFESAEHISRVLEALEEYGGESGATIAWCRRTARRLRCAVVAGLPLREPGGGLRNAQVVVDAAGAVAATYGKHQLYCVDKTWATKGPGFVAVDLEPAGVRVALGICMDINPDEFEAPWTAYELASFVKREGCQVLLFSSAWCNAHPDDADEVRERPIDVQETVQYWVSRLAPLIGTGVAFVCADRVGKEADSRGVVTTFCGSSCVVELTRPPVVRALLDATTEGVMLATVPLPPRPEQV